MLRVGGGREMRSSCSPGSHFFIFSCFSPKKHPAAFAFAPRKSTRTHPLTPRLSQRSFIRNRTSSRIAALAARILLFLAPPRKPFFAETGQGVRRVGAAGDAFFAQPRKPFFISSCLSAKKTSCHSHLLTSQNPPPPTPRFPPPSSLSRSAPSRFSLRAARKPSPRASALEADAKPAGRGVSN